MEQKILIVAATPFEVASVIQHFELAGQKFAEHSLFDLLVTGVGMTATAFALGQYLDQYKYKLVLNVGIAGSFDPNIPLGNLVSIHQDTFAELGAEDHDNFLTIDELGFGTNKVIATAEVGTFVKVNGITVNTVHGNAQTIELARLRFNAHTESMEGAAVFYACKQLNIPCAQIRSISNYVTPRNKNEWQIELAIKNLNEWLVGFLVLST